MATPEETSRSRAGVGFALAAYGLWGFYGVFFKAMDGIHPLEVVAHRAFWSIPTAGLAILAMRKLGEVRRILSTPPLLLRLAMSATLVAISWGFFVWAIFVDRTLEASLGYYINPPLNVTVGYAVLGERFTRAQTVAIGLAILAVAVITIETGVLPWLALLLASSFAAYGYLRKTIPVGPVEGYMVESILLSVLGVGLVVWLVSTGEARFMVDAEDTLLLIACGPVTALPLMLFSAAARRLRFSTLGLLQYIAPTGLFLTAVFVFKEPVSAGTLTAFALIWSALALYTIEAIRAERGREV